MRSAKDRITLIVQQYIKENPDEWEAFKNMMTLVRASMKDEKFATLEGTEYSRALYEMPETLQMMFIKQLSEEEMIWLKDGTPSNRKEGGHWFATTFPIFAIPNHI